MASEEQPRPSGADRIGEMYDELVAREAERTAAERDRSELERREELYAVAPDSFSGIARKLLDELERQAPRVDALIATPPAVGAFSAELMGAALSLDGPELVTAPWGDAQQPAFDVIAHGSVQVLCPPARATWGGHSGYVGRSHSLYFCDALIAGRYGWFETAFMTSPPRAPRAEGEPFDLWPGRNAARALCAGTAGYQVAWPFTALVTGELDEFVDRWLGWFADAIEGRLAQPSRLPERPVDGI